MKLGKLMMAAGVLFTSPLALAETAPNCINTQPTGPFTGGKFKPAPTTKLVFHLAESKTVEGGSLDFDAKVYETGTIENQGNKLSILTAVVSVDEQMAGGDSKYMAVRYAAKNGSVLHLTHLDFQVPAEPAYTAFFASIEKKLQTTYHASATIRSTAPINGLSLPKCKLRTSRESWVLQSRSLPLSKSMHPVKLGPENTALKDESLWTSGDMDPLLYVKTPDQVFIGYSTDQPYAFEHAGNRYSCSTGPSKRDPTTEQERHRIVTGISEKDLKKLWTDPKFGVIYQPQGKAAERDLAEFRKRYDYNYDLVAGENSKNPSQPSPTPKLGASELSAKTPVVYVKDSFSRHYLCTADNLIPDISLFVEPLIYIYSGSTERFTVSLGPDVKIMGADPEPVRNSWDVSANSTGLLKVDGAGPYRSLFWEGRGPDFPTLPSAGVVLMRDQVETYLSQQLPKLGLRGREVSEFIHYWGPALRQYPAVLIDFILNDEVERFAPLVTSRPIRKIRVYLNYRPLDQFGDKDFPRKEYPTLSRPEGDLLIEWGGIHWTDSELR